MACSAQWPLVRREYQLNYLSAFLARSFKLPLPHCLSGRSDQYRIPSYHPGGLNAAICPNHNFQLDRTRDVHAFCECRISWSNSADHLSVHMALLLGRASPREHAGTNCQHKDQAATHTHRTHLLLHSIGRRRGADRSKLRWFQFIPHQFVAYQALPFVTVTAVFASRGASNESIQRRLCYE